MAVGLTLQNPSLARAGGVQRFIEDSDKLNCSVLVELSK